MQPSIIELTTNLSAATLSINNVSDALGLNGDGPFSLQVITKFAELQADNETLRAMVQELTAQRDALAPVYTEAVKLGNAKINPLPIKRDELGYWTHPEYAKFFGDRERVPLLEFDEWLNSMEMEYHIVELECADESPAQDRYFEKGDLDIHDWEPVRPRVKDGSLYLSTKLTKARFASGYGRLNERARDDFQC